MLIGTVMVCCGFVLHLNILVLSLQLSGSNRLLVYRVSLTRLQAIVKVIKVIGGRRCRGD